MSGDFDSILDVLHGTPIAPDVTNSLLQAKLDDIYKVLVQALSVRNEVSQAAVDRFDRAPSATQLKLLASPEVWDTVGVLKSHHPPHDLNHAHLQQKVLLIVARLLIAEGGHTPDDTDLVLSQVGPVFVSPAGDVAMTHIHGNRWNRTQMAKIGQTIALDFDSPLAKQSNLTSVVFSLPCLEWTEGEKVLAGKKIERAIAYMDTAAPQLGLLVRNFVRRIFLRKSVDIHKDGRIVGEFAMSSEHLPRYPGTIGLSNPQVTDNTVVKIMESVLHESVHNFLACYETAHGHFMSSDRAYRPISPWSGNNIPNHSLSHAIFVYYACHHLFERCLALGVFEHGSEAEQAEARIGDFASGFLIGRNLSSLFALNHSLNEGLRSVIERMQKDVINCYAYNVYLQEMA